MASTIKRIQVRNDLAATWATVNPVLAVGEIGYAVDDKVMKAGDGVTPWNSLPAIGGSDVTWEPTTNGMTLVVGKHYIIGAGHTVNFPAGVVGDAIYAVPQNGNWSTLGATLNPPGGWTIGDGQSPIPATSDSVTFLVNTATNYMVSVGGAANVTELAMVVADIAGPYTCNAFDLGRYNRVVSGPVSLYSPLLDDRGRQIVFRNVTGAPLTIGNGGSVVNGSLTVANNESLSLIVTAANNWDAIGGI